MRCLLPWLLMGAPLAAQAQVPVVVSAAPDKVAVTLYRDPARNQDSALDADDPSAFALVAETRTITLPPGEVTVRFEGVASGIVPQSAILFGTPPRERNRDAALLSQGGLVDAFTGQRVTLRRTDPATGQMVEEPATIRSGANRLVATTPRGTEALYCSGLNQTLLYPSVPGTLSAKPVLSMTTKDQPGGQATITLAYIATGFDWDATYVGTLAPDGRSLSLLGWLTLASGDDTSFPDATASAVAGKVSRSDETQDETGEEALWEARSLDKGHACWPAGTTSTGPHIPVGSPAPAPMMMDMEGNDIIVTAQRREEAVAMSAISVTVIARAESLGDLKLYRIPVPVTVAARSQKQVAFLVKDRVPGQLLYRSTAWDQPGDPQMLFRFQNRKRDGMGDPLPGGKVTLYQQGPHGRMLIGETSTPDKTVDEEVELTFGEANNLTIETDMDDREDSDGRDRDYYTVVIRNANPFPVRYEVDFRNRGDLRIDKISGRVTDKPGKRVWATTIAANGTERLTYRTSEIEDEEE